jgi:hypothetical protein
LTKIPCASTAISEVSSSTFIKSLWPAHAATSSNNVQIGTYFFWPNHSRETHLSKQKEEEEEGNVATDALASVFSNKTSLM